MVATTIDQDDWNTLLADLETALTESIAKDGQTPTTASIPFASGIKADTVAENSSNTGVTVDSVLMKDGRVDFAKGADIASATTTDIGASTGNFIDITGTTTITGFGTSNAGVWRILQFDGALTITYNATSMILPGNVDLKVKAGDIASFVSLGSGNWILVHYLEEAGYATRTTAGNAIINGNFAVAQRGTSFTSVAPVNTNDSYTLDRWLILSETTTDGYDVSQFTTAASLPVGSHAAILLDCETNAGGAGQAGICQILENKDTSNIRGKAVTLSFKAKIGTNTTVDTLRAGIASWTSTADTVTSDIVATWNAEDTNPTLATNWAFDNTPASLTTLTSSWQTLSVTATVDATAANVAVLIWINNDDATVGDTVYITDVQLEEGSVATPFEHENHATTLAKCQRFYFRISSTGSNTPPVYVGHCISTTVMQGMVQFPVPMRAAPTLDSSAVADFNVRSNAGTDAVSALALGAVNETSFDRAQLQTNVASGLVGGEAGELRADGGGARWIDFSAEL